MTNNQKNREGNREVIDNGTNVANQDLVHMGTRTSNSRTYHYRESTPPSARHQQTITPLPEAEIDSHILPQEQAPTNRVFKTAQKVICTASAPQTKCKYKSIFKKWKDICGERSTSTIETDEINVIQFPTEE